MKSPRTIVCALLVMACCTRGLIEIATGCYFGQSTRLRSDSMSLAQATVLFSQEHGALPRYWSKLVETEPRYLDELPFDPWGAEYLLEIDPGGENLRVGTYGEDGVPGGRGDDEDVFGEWHARI